MNNSKMMVTLLVALVGAKGTSSSS